MSSAFTASELREIISTLKTAFKNAAASGGVTSYTLSSGQGTSTVHQSSLAEITAQLRIYEGMLNEVIEIESGANFTYIRDLGL